MNKQLTLIAIFALATIIPGILTQTVTESGTVNYFNQREKQERNDDLKEKYDSEYEAFMGKLSELVGQQNSNHKEVKVGEYTINYQTECTVNIDFKPPVLGSFEKDCYSAEAKAAATAKMIVDSAPSNPPSLSVIQEAVTNCELELKVKKSFSITNLCYEDGFVSNFKDILAEYNDQLTAAGFTESPIYSEDGQTVTFNSDEVHTKINLENHEAVTSTITPLIGTSEELPSA